MEKEDSDIWISVDYQGLFHFDRVQDRLINCLHRDKRKNQLANVTRFWFEEKLCWVSLYDDNLYYTKDNFKTLFPFQDSEGKEPFKDDIINTWIMGPHNCWYIGSSNGLTEINLTTGRVRRLLNYYVRDLGFKSDKELWVGTESGLFDLSHKSSGRHHGVRGNHRSRRRGSRTDDRTMQGNRAQIQFHLRRYACRTRNIVAAKQAMLQTSRH